MERRRPPADWRESYDLRQLFSWGGRHGRPRGLSGLAKVVSCVLASHTQAPPLRRFASQRRTLLARLPTLYPLTVTRRKDRCFRNAEIYSRHRMRKANLTPGFPGFFPVVHKDARVVAAQLMRGPARFCGLKRNVGEALVAQDACEKTTLPACHKVPTAAGWHSWCRFRPEADIGQRLNQPGL